MKLFHAVDMYLKYIEYTQYDILDIKYNYFRSFNYTIAVPRPPADMS